MPNVSARGDLDLAGVGRGLIANLDWVNIVKPSRFEALRAYDAVAHTSTLEQAEVA